jgi:hypothetical protein
VSHIAFASEEELLLPLLRYLVRQRLIRSDTLVATQLRFNEKWIDLVTLTSTGSWNKRPQTLFHAIAVTPLPPAGLAQKPNCTPPYSPLVYWKFEVAVFTDA